ncbi:MAG TPA: VWA domain-containing protein [Candidatus Babeliales bacterium]|nr:VWA domain-containing protein [Candidatus Babeliales bacterium]
MKTFFGEITFALLGYRYFFPLVVLACILIFFIAYRRFRGISKLASVKRRRYLVTHFSVIKLFFKVLLLMAGCASLFIVFLRPQWGTIEQTIEQEGRDLFIALDVSRSMLAQDKQPNRLAFAKEKIKQLVGTLKSERVGLVIFSGSALVQCPLTVDYGAFFLFLNQIDAETISSGTTALDQVLKKIIDVFTRAPARKNKLVVILTDGEDFSSNLTKVREQAREVGVHIFTLGIGTPEGAPVPVVDDDGRQHGHQKNEKGEIVISRLNEGILRALSAESGGAYVRASDGDADIKELVRMVEQFEKEKFEDKTVPTLQERYPIFAVIAFVCFLLEWLL